MAGGFFGSGGAVVVAGGAISVGGVTDVDVVGVRTGGGCTGAALAAACCCGVIAAETFMTLGSSDVTGVGLLASEPGDFRDSPSCGDGNVSCFGPFA